MIDLAENLEKISEFIPVANDKPARTFLISGGLDCLVNPDRVKQFIDIPWEQRAPSIEEELEISRRIQADGVSISIPTLGELESEMLGKLIDFANNYPQLLWIINIGHSSGLVIKKAVDRFHGTPLINFTTMERRRLREVLPIVKDTDAKIVAQTLNDQGVQWSFHDRLDMVKRFLDEIEKESISLDRIFLDPLTLPLVDHPAAIASTIKLIQWLKINGIKTISWIGNISLGVADREPLNAAYISILVACGVDAVVIDSREELSLQNFYSSIEYFNGGEYA